MNAEQQADQRRGQQRLVASKVFDLEMRQSQESGRLAAWKAVETIVSDWWARQPENEGDTPARALAAKVAEAQVAAEKREEESQQPGRAALAGKDRLDNAYLRAYLNALRQAQREVVGYAD